MPQILTKEIVVSSLPLQAKSLVFHSTQTLSLKPVKMFTLEVDFRNLAFQRKNKNMWPLGANTEDHRKTCAIKKTGTAYSSAYLASLPDIHVTLLGTRI